MKKYLLALVVFIFGIFFLASCDDKSSNILPTNKSADTPSQDNDEDKSKKSEDTPSQNIDEAKSKDDDSGQTTPQVDVYFDVVFKNYDGTVLQESQIKEGTIPTYNKSNPVRLNDENYKYEFTGWSPEITIVTSDSTYIAQYNRTELPYTISFDLDGGTSKSGVSTIKIETLTKDKFKFDITKSKYVFRGWEYNGTQVFDENGNIINNIQLSSNMIFKAIYEESVTLTITYSIYNPRTNQLIKTYNTKPNDLGNVSETRSYHYNTPVNLFSNPNEGYTFIGWYYNGLALSNESNYNYMMWEDNITLDARFEYTKYDLNIWSNNYDLGQVMIKNGTSQTWYNTQSQKQYYTESTTVAAFTKTDIRFLGWYDEKNNLVSTSAVYTFNMPNKNYTLEAKWNYFNITYDLDGGTNNINNPTSYNKDMNNIHLLNPTKEGYTFVGWEYKGNIITEINTSNVCHMELKAKWSIHTNTPYKVEHYLQNLDDDNYPDTPYEVDNLTGTTDTLTNGEVNTYAGFISPEITQVNINGDESTVIKLYYVRKTYEISSNNVNAGSIIGCGIYKYGKNITIQITPYLGYTYIGTYMNNSLYTDKLAYVIESISSNYEIGFGIIPELSNFTFTSTLDNLTITDVKDKTVTNIVVPNIVTNISLGAFRCCSSLESITLAFVGDKRHTSADTYQYPLGYIFGEQNYTGGTSSQQYYYGSSSTSTTYSTYYIPTTLKEVIITDCEYIQYGAFYNCSSLTNITIPNSVTSIGIRAFYNCSKLTNITIPNGVTSIGSSAFSGCSSLESITLPFIGDKKHKSTDTYQYPFGYIFGYNSYTGGTSTQQYYYASSTTSTTSSTFYIPTTLKEVIITDCEYIQYGAFYNCSSLTSITIPNGVTSIENDAFNYCSSLVYYDGTIEDWCNITFSNYYSNPMSYNLNEKKFYMLDESGDIEYNGKNYKLLTELEIPSTVTSIGNYQFSKFNNLTNITIPNSVTSIGSSAFYNCSKLTSITIPNSVTSIGSYAFYNCNKLTSITIPNSVKSIGDSAFEGCSSLESITIPNSVKSIGDSVFSGCSSLESITIPNSVTSIGSYAFYNCSKLTSITIPNSVTSIGVSAFSGCSSLTNVYYDGTIEDWYNIKFGSSASNPMYYATNFYILDENGDIEYNGKNYKLLTELEIPTTVTSIGKCQFCGFNELTSITIPNSVTSIDYNAFSGCSSLESITLPFVGDKRYTSTDIGSEEFSYIFGTVPKTLKEVIITDCEYIQYGAFNNCDTLTSITIPNSITSIGSSAFYNCSSLESITIPNSVKSIGDSAFSGCSSLESITIPNSVTSIGSYAFKRCSSLTSITIPNSVTSISEGAFSECSSLANVYYDGTIEDWCNITFDSNYYSNPMYYATNFYILDGNGDIEQNGKNYKLLTELEIPSTVKTIGNDQFYNFKLLTSIEIPNSVTSIGNYAFYYCSSLTSIEIPNSVTIIGNSTFYKCSSLSSITIPNSVTSIGERVFSGCSSLTNVYYKGTKEEWTSISIDSYGNSSLTNATRYYYSEEEPLESGNYWHYDIDGKIKIWE